MALFIQQVLVCAASLLLALSCARVEPAANTPDNAAAAAAPDAPLLSAAEPIVLSPEDQTEDALNNVRRADETARAGGGGVAQLTPAEHGSGATAPASVDNHTQPERDLIPVRVRRIR